MPPEPQALDWTVGAGGFGKTTLARMVSADPRAAWWDLGHGDRYLWDHLIEHLNEAGRPDQAEILAWITR